MVSDWPETLIHRIDQVAKANGDKVALADGIGKSLTYSEMINRIEAVAEALQKAGIGAGSRVLVFQQPSVNWACSMLAIMRIGAIYVPLDLRNPVTRLAAVAKDCEAIAVLADASTVDEAPQLQIDIRINVSSLGQNASTCISNRAESNSPAAILYTSGSTGTPKGIVVTHAGLRNEIEGYTKTWGLKAERVLQQSAMTFNHSSDQIYTGLVNGGMVYVVPAEQRGDPLSITKILQEQAITYTKATPSEYLLWLQYGYEKLQQASKWRFAFAGGEQLTSVVTDGFATLGLSKLVFHNSYGPTEISISSHKMVIPYTDKEAVRNLGRIPCGYSLPNYRTYIVDEQLKPVPIGMPGEVCIGGAGVSLGYLNNHELTDQHFIKSPFATPDDIARGWTRMYRTGDIGYLREDGALVYHSRIVGDTQVKIRGIRIELSDIESSIVAAAGGILREAVVTVRDDDLIVVHVVFAPQQSNVEDKNAFLERLLSQLPIPQYSMHILEYFIFLFPTFGIIEVLWAGTNCQNKILEYSRNSSNLLIEHILTLLCCSDSRRGNPCRQIPSEQPRQGGPESNPGHAIAGAYQNSRYALCRIDRDHVAAEAGVGTSPSEADGEVRLQHDSLHRFLLRWRQLTSGDSPPSTDSEDVRNHNSSRQAH